MERAYTVEEAKNRVQESLENAIEFAERTRGVFTNIETIKARREELLDIITTLQWRYGEPYVKFFFSKKKVCPARSIPIEIIIEDTTYAGRIYVLEDDDSGVFTFANVYIRF